MSTYFIAAGSRSDRLANCTTTTTYLYIHRIFSHIFLSFFLLAIIQLGRCIIPIHHHDTKVRGAWKKMSFDRDHFFDAPVSCFFHRLKCSISWLEHFSPLARLNEIYIYNRRGASYIQYNKSILCASDVHLSPPGYLLLPLSSLKNLNAFHSLLLMYFSVEPFSLRIIEPHRIVRGSPTKFGNTRWRRIIFFWKYKESIFQVLGYTLKYLCTVHRYGDKRIETIARLIIKQGFILEGIYSNWNIFSRLFGRVLINSMADR